LQQNKPGTLLFLGLQQVFAEQLTPSDDAADYVSLQLLQQSNIEYKLLCQRGTQTCALQTDTHQCPQPTYRQTDTRRCPQPTSRLTEMEK